MKNDSKKSVQKSTAENLNNDGRISKKKNEQFEQQKEGIKKCEITDIKI